MHCVHATLCAIQVYLKPYINLGLPAISAQHFSQMPCSCEAFFKTFVKKIKSSKCKIGDPWLSAVVNMFARDPCLILKAAKKLERIGLEHFLISQGHLRLLNSTHRLVVPKTGKALSECRLTWLMLLEDLPRPMKSHAFSMTPTANFTLWFAVLRLV